MPEKTPPSYMWAVTHSGSTVRFNVEAAYSDVEDTGHMVLKNPDGNPVFTAEPGLGCTFQRGARAGAAAMASVITMLTGEEAEIAKQVAAGDISINAGRRVLGLRPFDEPEAGSSAS